MEAIATSTRWPAPLLNRVQRYADAHSVSRQAALCVLVTIALQQWEREQASNPT